MMWRAPGWEGQIVGSLRDTACSSANMFWRQSGWVPYVLIELPLVASKTGPDSPAHLSNLAAGRTLISDPVSTWN